MDWDTYFFKMCDVIASKSKDTSTKVGCVIVGPDHEIRSTGYNGFPRGAIDSVKERFERPLKYKWTEHSERNSIYNSARMGISLNGCRIYINSLPPCTDCARALIQSGIIEVNCSYKTVPDRWKEDTDIAIKMLEECGVKFYHYGVI